MEGNWIFGLSDVSRKSMVQIFYELSFWKKNVERLGFNKILLFLKSIIVWINYYIYAVIYRCVNLLILLTNIVII